MPEYRLLIVTRASRVMVVVAVAGLLGSACRGGGGTPGAAQGSHVYGSGTTALRLNPPPSGSRPRVTEAQARQLVDNPVLVPGPQRGHLILFAYARVSVTGDIFPVEDVRSNAGKARPAPYAGRPAWVGVYQVDTSTTVVHCKAVPAPPPPGFRLVPGQQPKSFYFAVIVDPDTSAQTAWFEGTNDPCPHLVSATPASS